ncbi:MAG: sigma-70 family RNA polymerase sigma factor [Hyphomicrobium sp.]
MSDQRSEFERQMMLHLDAAHDLARWLVRHPQDAEDATQEAIMRAFRAFGQFKGGNAKAWLLTIVRNVCMTRLKSSRSSAKVVVLQDVIDEIDKQNFDHALGSPARPDEALQAKENCRQVHDALASLPEAYREVLILREFDELSYEEIAVIVGVPVGTVMSRLARARQRMRKLLDDNDDAGAVKRKGR